MRELFDVLRHLLFRMMLRDTVRVGGVKMGKLEGGAWLHLQASNLHSELLYEDWRGCSRQRAGLFIDTRVATRGSRARNFIDVIDDRIV
jgi:hypothetical protein